MQASGADLWATEELLKVIEEAKQFKPDIIAAILLNRVVSNTKLSKEVLENLTELELDYFDSYIKQRQIYALAISNGLTVYEMPNNQEAIKEVESVIDEILKIKRAQNGN